MKFNDVPEVKFERLPYPKDEIEHLVKQLIDLHDSNQREYDQEIVNAMATINEYLKLLTRPYLVLKGELK